MNDDAAALRLQKDIHFIWKALKRKRLAAVVSYLFHLHKNDIQYWVAVHRELMSTSISHSDMEAVALVAAASKFNTLLEASSFIPGLTPTSTPSPELPVE